MAEKFKINNVYYYQFRPAFTNKKDDELARVKTGFKNALKFSKKDIIDVRQGEGTVSPLKGELINVRYVGGALIYSMESNIPPKVAKGKDPEQIDMSGFSGLGYDAAYFYDSENMIIGIESRVPGPTLNSLRSLILANYELPGFDFIPITSKNAYEEFLKSEGVRSLEMTMLSIDELPEKNRAVRGISESKELVDNLNGDHITIQVGSGQKRSKFLNKAGLRTMADWALSSLGGKNEVSKFKLNIVDLDSGKVKPIDLISGRIKDKTEIGKVRTINKFSVKEKINQIEGHYLRRRPYLDESFKL